MISLAIAIGGFVATFAVMKNNLSKAMKKDEEQDRELKAHDKKLTILEQKVVQAPTMEQARVEFVAKEMFKQFEKHIDKRFDTFEKKFDGLGHDLKQILAVLKG